eukprot:5453108-Amphidinium_carterae.2
MPGQAERDQHVPVGTPSAEAARRQLERVSVRGSRARALHGCHGHGISAASAEGIVMLERCHADGGIGGWVGIGEALLNKQLCWCQWFGGGCVHESTYGNIPHIFLRPYAPLPGLVRLYILNAVARLVGDGATPECAGEADISDGIRCGSSPSEVADHGSESRQ